MNQLLSKIVEANKLYTTGLHATDAYLGVDFDKTLTSTDGLGESKMNPGEPIWPIVNLTKQVLSLGIKVKIFTARVDFAPESLQVVEEWCEKNLGQKLEITNVKTASMFYLLDDKAFNVTPNGETHDPHINGLTKAQLERLTLISEECSEVIQMVNKIIRFGFESTHPNDGLTNRQRLAQELGDLSAAVELSIQGQDVSETSIEAGALIKLKKINKYLKYNTVDLLGID